MSKTTEEKLHLRQINNGLSVVVILLSLYIMAAPLLPAVSFWWKNHFGSKPPLVIANSPDKGPDAPPEVIPEENTLVIPGLSMQETIHGGSSAAALRKGVWHRPGTSSPDKGSNTVLVGHRFTYDGAAVFYHLDTVKEGDRIVLYWNKQKYSYEVSRVFVVPPTAGEIEFPTEEPLLTIYTCTPLFTAKDRLVIQAKPVEGI